MSEYIDLNEAAPIEDILDAEAPEAAGGPSDLDRKVNEHFAGAVVRKDLVKARPVRSIRRRGYDPGRHRQSARYSGPALRAPQ